MNAKNLVVGFDFSESAVFALQYATELASASGAVVRVVYAWNPTGWTAAGRETEPDVARMLEQARDRAREDLFHTIREMSGSGLEVEGVFEVGAASQVLPEVASSSEAAMLIVGRHGHANMAHVLLGSVSERVVQSAPCPVLVVPKRSESANLPNRLMVGIDYSRASAEALRAAHRFATDLGCARPLLVANACQDEREMWLANWSEARPPRDRETEEHELQHWAADHLPEGARFDCVVVEGYAERRLPATARSEQCDWIVLGRQGRSALDSVLIGSTTQRIMKLADRPVLVVPNRPPGPDDVSD